MEEMGWRQIEFGGGLVVAIIAMIWPTPPPMLLGLLVLISIALLVDGLARILKYRKQNAGTGTEHSVRPPSPDTNLKIVEPDWVAAEHAINLYCNPNFVSIRDQYVAKFQDSYSRYQELEGEMHALSQGGWKDRPEALDSYNQVREQWERLGAVITASQQGLRDVWAVLRDEFSQMLVSGTLIARGTVEPYVAGAGDAPIKSSEWRTLEPDPFNGTAVKKGEHSSVVYSKLEIGLSDRPPADRLGMAPESPLEIIFNPANPHRRFWSLEQAKDQTGQPIPGHLWWEYRVLIRNKSAKTVRNVNATVEAIGPMPTRPEPTQFDINKQQLIDLHPLGETLAILRRWFNPPIVVGMVMGGAYGPIKMTVSGDDVLPDTKYFHFEPENVPMISEILW